MQSYFKIPSNAPYAWFIWALIGDIFGALYDVTNRNPVFGIIGLIFAILVIIQVGYNLINLIKTKPKFNTKKFIINIFLVFILNILVTLVTALLKNAGLK